MISNLVLIRFLRIFSEGFKNTVFFALYLSSIYTIYFSSRITMSIFQLNVLTDEIMDLSHEDFFKFLQETLNKDLCELFQVQAIRDMSSLSSVTIEELIEIFNFEVEEYKDLKKALGYTTTDGSFHLRLAHRKLLEHLLSLVKQKKTLPMNNRVLSNSFKQNDINVNIVQLLKQEMSNLPDGHSISVLLPWIRNIFQNLQTTKNKYKYDIPIEKFALLIYIFGGRNCYEFLRLNLSGSLPHVSRMESLIRNQEMMMIEGEFRFQSMQEYSKSSKCNYVFIAEDATSATCRVDYDATLNAFIGLSPPLVDGLPQVNFFQTENFDQLELWFNEIDKAKLINLIMLKSLSLSDPPFILSAYGSNGKAEAIDILKRWLFIYDECRIRNVHVIGFSSDADARYLRSMRLCSRFFATLPNFDLFKHRDMFRIKIPSQWSWFFMEHEQILFFMQDGIHIATKFRNRLLSRTAKLKMGSHWIDIQDLFDLIQSESKMKHNLIKCDVDPKDRQNFRSCLRISSQDVLNLLEKNEKAKGTYVYLSLLRSLIIALTERPITIEERLFHIWTVVFTCRFWFSWIQSSEFRNDSNTSISSSTSRRNMFITKPTFWCIEINAHTLLSIVLLVIQNKLPIDALNTFVFNSQICENTFRIARSLSGSFSSNTNFSVKSFLKRCEKIAVINSIKNCDGQIAGCQFSFPQHHKTQKESIDYSRDYIDKLNISEADIELIIKNAFEQAQKYVSMVGMTEFLKKKNIYTLSSLNTFMKSILNKSRSKIIDYTADNDSSDEESDEEDLSNTSDAGDQLLLDDDDDDDEEEQEDEGNSSATNLPNPVQEKFNGCRIYDTIDPRHSKKYLRIRIGSSYKFVHKQTACWLLTTDKLQI